MLDIYVNTDNTDTYDKTFNGLRAGKAQAKAEEKMQNAVKRIVDKANGFTTKTAGKGYTIKLKIGKVEIAGSKTKCSLTGFAVRYPPEVNKKGEKSEVLATGMIAGNAMADGTSDAALLDCVDSIAEDMAGKAIPAMREDMLRR
jgi:hypothetical protein